MKYVLSIPFDVPEIILVALLYLCIDLYPKVKSFRAMLATTSFLLLWLIFSVMTGISYFFLTTTSLAKVQGVVGLTATKLTIIVLGALMGSTVIQSLSLKVQDIKIVDLNPLIENYREQVVLDMIKKNSTKERLRALRIADKLATKFRNNRNEIMEEYSQLLLSTGQTPESATQLVQSIERNARDLNISEVKLIAGTIARLDCARAKQLLS